jgi:predicted  nucleic acid-binding Zn-ribbon protein
MKRLALLVFGIGLLALVGCEGTPTSTPAVDKDTVKKKYEEYKQELNTKLEEMDEQIDQWEKKAAEETGEAKEAMEKKLENLKVRRADVRKKLDELGDASAEAWEKTKDGVEDAFRQLQESYKEAKKEFNK